MIIEENLTANFIERISKRNEYIEKFREYKNEYKRRYHQSIKNKNNPIYRKDVEEFIDDMKPYNKKLNNDEITKEQYLAILNKRKNIYAYK